MFDMTGFGASTAQAAKAAQRRILALCEVVEASKRTGELVKEFRGRLLSTNEVLGYITTKEESATSCQLNLSSKAHIHLRMAITSTQHTCERFLSTFNEWKNHSASHYLHESDSGDFDVLEETELRLVGERLHMLEYTILMAFENSVLIDSISTPRTFSDRDSILCRENELLSARIEMNQKQHVLQDRGLALKRIVRESEDYEIGMLHNRNVIGELLSETICLGSGRPVDTEEEHISVQWPVITNPSNQMELCIGVDPK